MIKMVHNFIFRQTFKLKQLITADTDEGTLWIKITSLEKNW